MGLGIEPGIIWLEPCRLTTKPDQKATDYHIEEHGVRTNSDRNHKLEAIRSFTTFDAETVPFNWVYFLSILACY